MSYHSRPNWPPVWLARYERDKTVQGEIGTLKQVADDCRARQAKCYLYITYEAESYIGTLLFDDPMFCQFIASFLQQHCGKRIEDIAALDVSETL